MGSAYLRVEQVEAVTRITLDDPSAMNALSEGMVSALGAALREAAKNEARCVLLTGAGRAFCAGADMKNRPTPEQRAQMVGSNLQLNFHPLFRMLRDFPAPIVTAVNGAAVGGGMSLAMMGDMIIAAESAYFLQSFRNIGLVPDCGSSWLLPRLIGSARAREMSMLGERLAARQALDWGLVNRVVEDEALPEHSHAIAQRLADGPRDALVSMRHLYWHSTSNSYEEQLDLEDRFQASAAVSWEAAEGIAAFREKRVPRFQR